MHMCSRFMVLISSKLSERPRTVKRIVKERIKWWKLGFTYKISRFTIQLRQLNSVSDGSMEKEKLKGYPHKYEKLIYDM